MKEGGCYGRGGEAINTEEEEESKIMGVKVGSSESSIGSQGWHGQPEDETAKGDGRNPASRGSSKQGKQQAAGLASNTRGSEWQYKWCDWQWLCIGCARVRCTRRV